MSIKFCRNCETKKEIVHFSRGKKHCKECVNKINKDFRALPEEEQTIILTESSNVRQQKRNEKSEPFKCECGGVYIKIDGSKIKRHEQSKKHQDFINGITKDTTRYQLSYYDELDNYKRHVFNVSKEIFNEFNNRKSKSVITNYKILKEMKFI